MDSKSPRDPPYWCASFRPASQYQIFGSLMVFRNFAGSSVDFLFQLFPRQPRPEQAKSGPVIIGSNFTQSNLTVKYAVRRETTTTDAFVSDASIPCTSSNDARHLSVYCQYTICRVPRSAVHWKPSSRQPPCACMRACVRVTADRVLLVMDYKGIYWLAIQNELATSRKPCS